MATSRLYAKVCPQCLREHGITRLSWQLRSTVGCFRHGYTLTWSCPHCNQAIGWDRPDVDICRCGRHIQSQGAPQLEDGVHAWLCWVEAALSGERSAPVSGALPAALMHLSVDGAFGIVEALGILAAPGRSVRGALLNCKTLPELGAVVHRGLERLRAIEADAGVLMRCAQVVNQPALARIAADGSTEEDRALAWWLLQGMRSGVDHGNTRAGGRPRGQLPLFIA